MEDWAAPAARLPSDRPCELEDDVLSREPATSVVEIVALVPEIVALVPEIVALVLDGCKATHEQTSGAR